MTQWQDIETAPKDGTWVLLGGCEYGYEQVVARWYQPPPHENGSLMPSDWWDYEHRGFKPTHWMPLPAPPQNGESA